MATLTPDDIAADLRVCRETAMRMLRDGVLPRFKVGRYWRVDSEEYAEWKARASARPADPNRIPPRSARSQAALNRRR